MILLFDIDGTLISCGGAGARSISMAFEEVFGTPDAFEGISFAGSTDHLLIEAAIERRLGRSILPDDPVDEVFERYLVHLETQLEGTDYRLLCGVLSLLEELAELGEHVIGLATGNIERGAMMKLARGGLDGFFEFGGFGSDARLRPDVVKHAVTRGRQRSKERPGTHEEVLVIGDTEHDVTAARANGVKSVGVLDGAKKPDALRAANPDLLIESFEEAEFRRILGLGID